MGIRFNAVVERELGTTASFHRNVFYSLDEDGIETTASAYNLSTTDLEEVVEAWDSAYVVFHALARLMYPEKSTNDPYSSEEIEDLIKEINKNGVALFEVNKVVDPCLNAYRACMNSAASEYAGDVAQCYIGGLALTVAGGGSPISWLGLALGVGCLAAEALDYNNDKKVCKAAYEACATN